MHATKIEKCIKYAKGKADIADEGAAGVIVINDSLDCGECPQDEPNPGPQTERSADEEYQKDEPKKNVSAEEGKMIVQRKITSMTTLAVSMTMKRDIQRHITWMLRKVVVLMKMTMSHQRKKRKCRGKIVRYLAKEVDIGRMTTWEKMSVVTNHCQQTDDVECKKSRDEFLYQRAMEEFLRDRAAAKQ